MTDPEREAVRVAAAYLSRGPEGLWESLSPSAPLRRLRKDRALREIAVRLGSPEGARWELRTPPPAWPGAERVIFSLVHPSGLDEAVVFNLVKDAGGYRLRGLRSLSEPVARSVDVDTSANAFADAFRSQTEAVVIAGALFLVGTILVTFAVPLRTRPWVGLAFLLLGLGVLTKGALVLIDGERELEARFPAQGPPAERTQSLERSLSFRERLERGERLSSTAAGAQGMVERLWQAQLAIQRGDLAEGKRLLSTLKGADEMPWADVLRGRLAFLQKRQKESVEAYQNLIDWGVYHDGLLVEAIQAFAILGFQTPESWAVEKLLRSGARSAEAWYALSFSYFRKDDSAAAERVFLKAWSLRPLDRETLFGLGAFWTVLRQPSVFPLLRLGDPVEPADAAPATGSSPTPLSGDLRVSSTLLRVRFPGGGQLAVPLGASLAPPDAVREDAGAEGREDEERALRELPDLEKHLASLGALSQPALRAALLETCVALAQRHRWGELAYLTMGFEGSDEQVPPTVLLLRAEALRRTNRAASGREILAALEKNPILDRLRDPILLFQLGELFRAHDDLDGAVRSLERAVRVRRIPQLEERLLRLRSEQRLARAYSTLPSGQFELRYPGQRPEGPAEVGRILAKEWARMKAWIPANGRPVNVQLLPFEDFEKTFGSDILGLYDGTIRLPIVGVPRFSPSIVTLLTHELAHAMMADATDDRAPHWLQEGLAQRLEMTPVRTNKVPDLLKDGTYLSLSSLEETLRSFPDPELVEAAYHEAEWLIRFIEKTHGRKAVTDLLESFKARHTTEEAIRDVLGVSLTELDQSFRAFVARSDAREVREKEIVRYDYN